MISSRKLVFIIVGLAMIITLWSPSSSVDCAPTSNTNNRNNNNSNGNNRPRGLLSNLFRRQIGSSSSSNEGNDNSEQESEDPQTQTELEAQKFMDSLPGANAANSGPTTFRERVSDTFVLLRDGMSNQFRSLRENWTDTVEDLRDTWGNTQE